jgi:solute carrier family 25 folate transporter 32
MSVILASFASNLMTSPFWVIRTRMMTQTPHTQYHYHSIHDGFSAIIKREGFLALYKGFIPSTIGIIHPIIQFPLYEQLKHEFQGEDGFD